MPDVVLNALLTVAAGATLAVIGGLGWLIKRGIQARTSRPPEAPPQSVRVENYDARIRALFARVRKLEEDAARNAERLGRIDVIASSMTALARDLEQLETRVDRAAHEAADSHASIQHKLGDVAGALRAIMRDDAK